MAEGPTGPATMNNSYQRKLLSPKDLANAIGASESSVKRWTDQGRLEITRTSGGHRRIAVTEAIRFIRENQLPLLQPEVLGLQIDVDSGASAAEVGSKDPNADFHQLLLSGHDVGARNHLVSRFLKGESVAALTDGPIRSSMEQIGWTWKERSEGIFIEHRATEILAGLLQDLRQLVAPTNPIGRAIGGAVSGDPYRLPSLAVAATLNECGLHAVNLGANTPISVLRQASVDDPTDQPPCLVWISVSEVTSPGETSLDVSELVRECMAASIAVAIGGREAHRLEFPSGDQVFRGESLTELAEFVQRRVVRTNRD